MHRTRRLLAASLLGICVASPAGAFGLRMHLYIADQVFTDAADCAISLPKDKTQRLSTRVCSALRNPANRGYFLAGALGPDVFPDLLIGQNYIHPGDRRGRKAADWLEILIREAKTDEEIAFAYGVMVHASSDIFAHSYVNNYSGGVFELLRGSSKDIELRHFELEKYIDQRLDHHFDLDSLKVPAGLLVRSMVRTSYLPGQLDVSPAEISEWLSDPKSKVAKDIATRLKTAAPAAHMNAMWLTLAISEHAAATARCNQVLATRRMAQAFRLYVAAERYARGEGPQPAQKLADVRRCRPDQDVGTLTAAQADLDAALAASVYERTTAAYTGREAWWDALPEPSRRALRRAYDKYEDTVIDWKRMVAIGVMAPEWKTDVEQAVHAYMEASLEAAKVMVRNSEPYPPALHDQSSSVWPYRKWQTCYLPVVRGAPLAAAQATCARLDTLGTDIGLGEAAIHAGLGARRDLMFRYLDARQWLDRWTTRAFIKITRLVAPNLGKLVEHIQEPKRISRGDLNETYKRAQNGQLTFRCVADWIDTDLGLRAAPDGSIRADVECQSDPADHMPSFDPARFMPAVHAITLSKLALLDRDGVFAVARAYGGDPAGIDLTDTGTHYSLILDTARSLDGSYQWQGYSMPMVRGEGVAVRRLTEVAGYPIPAKERAEKLTADIRIKPGRTGFPYYQSHNLRQRVFSQLFEQPFEGQILRRVEFGAQAYPFAPCRSDPFRPISDADVRERICNVSLD